MVFSVRAAGPEAVLGLERAIVQIRLRAHASSTEIVLLHPGIRRCAFEGFEALRGDGQRLCSLRLRRLRSIISLRFLRSLSIGVRRR
jgi:hypothetical protein